MTTKKIADKHAQDVEEQVATGVRIYKEAQARIKTLEEQLEDQARQFGAEVRELDEGHKREVARLVDSIHRLEAQLAESQRASDHYRTSYDSILQQRDHYMQIVNSLDNCVESAIDSLKRLRQQAHDSPFRRVPIIGHTEEGEEALRRIAVQ